MQRNEFIHGSVTHLITLAACLGVTVIITWWGRRTRCLPTHHALLRKAIASGSLLSWIAAISYGFQPGLFSWESSLPLQFCNLANLIVAVTVLYRNRKAQSILYFWSISLCLWAFLTPFLLVGPADPWFWLFWIYHVFIPIGLSWVLFVDGFRPDWRDLRFALAATTGFTVGLATLNWLTGWNYGFVGPGKPGQPSPIDHLGPYPVRLVYMLLIGTALFTLLLLPWKWVDRSDKES